MKNGKTVSLTLQQALKQVEAHAAKREWRPAEVLCSQAFEQAPTGLLHLAAIRWIQVLRSQQRHAQACGVLHRWLKRSRWSLAGREPARVLLLYGLESLKQGQVLFSGTAMDSLSFSINGGHFDSTQLLRHADFAADRLFLDGSIGEPELLQLAQQASRYALIICTIADPASEKAALGMAARLCAAAARPVINPPAAVLATQRDEVAARLSSISGLTVPRVDRVRRLDSGLLHQRLRTHPEGLILRPENSQTGIGVQLAREPAAIDTWLGAQKSDALFATDYHDFAHPPGLYRKYRVFAVGGALLPEHMISAQQWNIHSADRRALMHQDPQLQGSEQDFLDNPERSLGSKAWQTLRDIAGEMQLDYFGIDFAQLPGGGLLLFEANPAMRLNFDHCERFPYLRPHLEAVSRSFCRHVRQALGERVPPIITA